MLTTVSLRREEQPGFWALLEQGLDSITQKKTAILTIFWECHLLLKRLLWLITTKSAAASPLYLIGTTMTMDLTVLFLFALHGTHVEHTIKIRALGEVTGLL
jgi:hypothetical protein